MVAEADFSGWATKAGLKCTDGRTITNDAFKHQDTSKVPLVWQHAHNEPSNVLGYAILEHRDQGVYCHGYFNSTDAGKGAKVLVEHGDITALSIYANQLVEKNKSVMHGNIKEVSLVLAGANPGARIEHVNIEHSDGELTELDDEAIITMGIAPELAHADKEEDVKVEEDKPEVKPDEVSDAEKKKQADKSEEDKKVEADSEDASDEADSGDKEEKPVAHADDAGETVQEVFDTLSDKQKDVVYYMIGQALKGDTGAEVSHSDQSEVQEAFDSFNDKQKDVVLYMIGEALEHADELSDDESDDDTSEAEADTDTEVAHSDDQEGSTMGRNIFEDNAGGKEEAKSLSHADQGAILGEAARSKGSLKTELREYALAHGIEDIGILFPDAKAVTSTPEWLARRQDWVAGVMDGTRHTPFARIKSLAADLTLPAARAKGYIKGNFKEEEFFKVSKRVTTPQTVYKKQKLDRDDILDITDFDVVVWLKGEMRLMLEEEIARAILLGDGRSAGDDDKINEENIRPIANDSDFYVTYVNVNLGDANSSAGEVVDALTLQRRHYRGSGNPTLYTSETFLARMLLVKDTLGRRIYPSIAELTAVLRVSNIVTCEIMDEPSSDVVAIVVNLQDYTVGADRGGDIAMFDDFDIDYNQQKYLIETRISGALTKPKSALVVKKVAASAVLRTPQAPSWNSGTHAVNVANTSGVVYKNKLNNATLVNGTPVTLSEDQTLTVIAVPASSNDYLESTAVDEFYFTYADGLVASSF